MPLVYNHAGIRAQKAKDFFETDLKLDCVEICENLTRDEIIQKF